MDSSLTYERHDSAPVAYVMHAVHFALFFFWPRENAVCSRSFIHMIPGGWAGGGGAARGGRWGCLRGEKRMSNESLYFISLFCYYILIFILLFRAAVERRDTN